LIKDYTMSLYPILSALLDYPEPALLDALPEIEAALHEWPQTRTRLAPLIESLKLPLIDVQQNYVATFDRNPSHSLHLFEHVHGESRDRGQAMVDLLAMYEDKGLAAVKNELPDYLPLFLEFLATLPQAEACDLLGQPAHILGALAERLRKRESPYEAALRALVALSSVKPNGAEVSALLALPDPDPMDLAALDAEWEDEAVQFGPGANDSCKDGLISHVRGAMRPAPGMPASRPVPPRP
jgi:nitrate reductase delta subunit